MRYILFVILFFHLSVSISAQKSKCYDWDKVMKVKPTALYEKHLSASKKMKLSVLKNDAPIKKHKKSGKLISVKSLGKGYRVQKLRYSQLVLAPRAKTALQKIAKTFYAKANGSTLTYTSLTRTLEDQCRLRKVNRNPSLGLSTHNYGNAFDVSYIRFNDRLKRNDRLEKILEKVLIQMEKAGKIYFIKEKQQNCFHITVR